MYPYQIKSTRTAAPAAIAQWKSVTNNGPNLHIAGVISYPLNAATRWTNASTRAGSSSVKVRLIPVATRKQSACGR